MFDLVIRNGELADGSGLPRVRADLGVAGDRIAKIGRINERGRTELDAEGRVVTPGFVDGHTHFDAQVCWDPLGTCSSWHGVTTAVMGHCGFTLAPSRSDARALVVRNLERAEDMSPAALSAGIDWTWETFPEYMDTVSQLPKGINFAANIGHSAVRTWVMGERAFEEEATDAEIDRMERVVREALARGAIGFTTTRNDLHQTSDDRPVASRLASWDEVVRLVHAMGDSGSGIFQITNESAASAADPAVRAEYFDRLGQLAVASRVPMAFGVSATPLGLSLLSFIDERVAAGAHMIGLAHSRGISVMLSFETRLPFDRLEGWQRFRRLSLAEQARQLRDPSVRGPLEHAARFGDYGSRIVGAEARPPDYTLMYPLLHPTPPHRSVAELAEERRVHPVALIIDLALEHGLRLFFVQPNARFDLADIETVLRHPNTVMTFSDSGAHVSQMADSSIQTHLLSYWVRDRQAFTFEEAVRMVTADPAAAWGFHDRGHLREGFFADLNIIDPDTLAPEMPELVADLPGGASRITQRARGIDATVVAGTVVLSHGEPTGALPGRLIRGPQAAGPGDDDGHMA